MTPTTPTDAQMKLADVTDEDREAAHEFHREMFRRLMDNELSKTLGEEEGDARPIYQAFARHRRATEARAQVLVELLEMMDGIEYKELNFSNYTHDDVCALNNAYVEMQLILTQALATWRRT